jgi:mono/diheme cytochrome c family protein
MKRSPFPLLAAASLIGGSISAAEADAIVAKGRHLVEEIAMCQDCHSPRLPDGSFDRAKWLTGAPLGFKPLMEMPWADVAPGIAGLPKYTDAQAVVFLTTGKRPDGTVPKPPMPEYRFTRAEAQAVIAYLRTLDAGQPPASAKP